MSKKKKNKAAAWLSRFEDGGKKKGKNKKKNREDDDRVMNVAAGIKLKNVKPSLDKKDVRDVHRAAEKPIKLPKQIEEAREVCNHVQETYSVPAFNKEFEGRPYLAKNLDMYARMFGEENLGICKGCFEVMVDRKLITVDETQRAFLLILAAMNHLMANYRMKKKELKELKSSEQMIEEAMKTVVGMLKELRTAEKANEPTIVAKTSYGGPTPVGNEAAAREETQQAVGLDIPEGMNL